MILRTVLRTLALPLVSVAALTLVAATPAIAQEQTLKVGSSAPKLTIGSWVQGEVSNLDDPNKTYIVEFWATWCAPCKKSIPHLTELYNKHRVSGLVIIGVSDEPLATVKPFVTKMSSTMAYPVAVDQEKKTSTDWMQAAKQDGIPCAFIVRKGKVLWIGNPLDETFDTVIEHAIAGRYNPELAKQAKATIAAAKDAVRIKNFKDAAKHYDAVIAIDPVFFGDIAILKYKMLLVNANDPVADAAWGQELLTKSASDGQTLGELALVIAKDDAINTRDYELAIRAADAAGAIAKPGDARALKLRAEVRYLAGQYGAAKELQYEAWMAAETAEKADYKRELEKYSRLAGKAQPQI